MKTEEKKGKKASEHKPKSFFHWVCENLESILWAVIFALVIRAFIIEAFQIPTGSMATALFGMHADITCENCGFSYSWGESGNPEDRSFGQSGLSICPLCQHKNEPAGARVKSGDKIMVFKNYSQFAPLERYQVVVFKAPTDLRKNYIKRLIALGGEKLQLSCGDVFINGRIAPKPLKVQESLWQPVYRSRFAKRKISGQGQHWAVAPPWTESDGVFSFGQEGASSIRLSDPIFDDYGYNDAVNSSLYRRSDSHVAGDLRISARIRSAAPVSAREKTPSIELALEEDGAFYALRACLDAKRTGWIESLQLLQRDGPLESFKNEKILLQKPFSASAAGMCLGFANVDNSLYVWADGNLVADFFVEEGSQLDGRIRQTRSSTALLAAGGAKVVFEDVNVDRDVYYYLPGGSFLQTPPDGTVSEMRDGQRYLLKGPAVTQPAPELIFDPPSSSIFVPRGTLMAMGDNCPISNDGRMWGPAPQDYLLGKAFFIWWPFNRIKLIR